MANHGMIVGLDIGTNTVKVLAADVRDQQVNVVAVGRAVSHGVRRGVIVDIEAAAQDIRTAMNQVAQQNGQQAITEVVASIPAYNIQIMDVVGTVNVVDSQHISHADVADAVKAAVAVDMPADRTVVDFLPTEFVVDDFDGIKDPTDMVGMRLTIKGMAYTAPTHVLDNLRRAISKAGLTVRDLVLSPLAYSHTVLTESEQEFGATVLDFGAGQTTATIVKDRQIRFITVFPAGGDNITKDISAVLNISVPDADLLKLDDGFASPDLARPDNQLVISVLGEIQPQQISERYLAEIIAARVDQVADKIGEKLHMVSAFKLSGGLIVTGGSAALRGLPETLRARYQVNTKVFAPEDLGLRHPGYTGAWALIHFAAQQSPIELVVKQALYDLPFLTRNASGLPPLASAAPRNTVKPAVTAEPTPIEPETSEEVREEIEKQTGQMKKFFSNFFD
jgi:cell division protein FtsA